MSDQREQERGAMWQALLAAVNELTRQQPGSYEHGSHGSNWWACPHGSVRSPATYSDDGTRVSVTFEAGAPDGSTKRYDLAVQFLGSEAPHAASS